MDLVGEHGDTVLFAKPRHLLQLNLRPHPAAGVLGIAQEHERRLRIGQILLQTLKVHLIAVVTKNERTLQGNPSVVQDGVEEDVVDGGLDEDLLRGGRELPDEG